MSDSPDDIPTFEQLAADPEIAPLLEFTPVVRSHAKADGWTPGMQRMFIGWLAYYGSAGKAADELGKARSGIDKVYKARDAQEFQASWDAAVALAEKRRIEALATRPGGAGALRAPVMSRARPDPVDGWGEADEPGEIAEEEKLSLLQNLAARFMKKVAIERRARLNGEIVAADFTLRQITFLEVLFDLAASEFGRDAGEVLRELRRGGHHPVEIVSTPFSDFLDNQRRIWWLEEGEAERPPFPDARFLDRHDQGPWGSRASEGYSLAIDQHTTGAMTPPARGYTAEQWRTMNHKEQCAARQRQFEEDAVHQREWERRAHEAWAASDDADAD